MKGSCGPMGETGAMGEKRLIGPAGWTGPQGVVGNAANTGAQREQGDTGRWRYEASMSSGAVKLFYFRYGNVSSINKIILSDYNVYGDNMTEWAKLLVPNSLVQIVKRGDPSCFYQNIVGAAYTSSSIEIDFFQPALLSSGIFSYGDILSISFLPPGPQGPQGAQGFQGLVGVQGFTGAQGEQGIPGLATNTGSQGIQGAQGIQGPQGEQGIPGLATNTGSQGVQGAQGFQGEQGEQGIPGLATNTGSQGPQGYTGPPGPPNYSGVNYRDLITFAFTQNNGTVGCSIAKNTYSSVIIFPQPTTVSITYLSFTFSNTCATSNLTIEQLYIYDLTNCTNYNFTGFDGIRNGATVVWQNNTAITISGADANKIFVYPYILSNPITSIGSPKPLGVVAKITTDGGSCQLMSLVIGYA
jgi:hypothetical protein